MKREELTQEELIAINEILAGHVVQNAVMYGRASSQGQEEAANVLNMTIGVAVKMQEDLLNFSLGSEVSDEFLEALSKMIKVQIKGMDVKKEQIAKEGQILLNDDDQRFYDIILKVSKLLPEVEVEESSIVMS